jgi:uncharacterized protein (DUF885 family)
MIGCEACRGYSTQQTELNRDLSLWITVSQRRKEFNMATPEELLAQTQAVLDSIEPVLDAVADDEAKQALEIQALKDQIANGPAITEAQMQALLDRANSIKSRLDAANDSIP